jgi:uncharacterized damage-inducible protein DinB
MKAVVLALSLAASLPATSPAQPASRSPDPAVGTARELWRDVTGFITRAAAELPEEHYGYRPVATVRTFGQLIGHIAGAQYLICAAALGEPPRAEDEIERTKSGKAELVAALRASTEYCDRAYGQTDAAVQQSTQLFGRERSRLFALGQNATHNGEHYGNLVTYLRMLGRVPPSSQRP